MINWSPTVAEEIVQNVSTLLVTAPGTVPLSRELGTPQDIVDMPQSIAGARLQATIIKAIRTYEPRATVSNVALTASPEGVLAATVTIVGVK